MMNRRSFLASTTAAAAATVASPWGAPALAQSGDELILGFATPKTGPYVSVANTNLIAATMAVEEINAAGGVNGKKIKLVMFDTAGDPKQAVIGVRQFAADDGALASIGPFSSSECKVVFPAAERLGIAVTSMASSAPNLANGFRFAFRNTTDEGTIIKLVLESIKGRGLPAASAAIAHATDDTVSNVIGSKVLPAVLSGAGLEPQAVVTFQHAAFDLSPQVSQLMENPTDLIGLGSPPEAAIKLAKEMQRQGHNGRIFGGTTIGDIELPKRMDGAGQGMTIGATFFKTASDKTMAFAEQFASLAAAEGSERTEPNLFDASTYDIVYLYAAAMEAAGTTGDPAKLEEERGAIADAMAGLKDLELLEGTVTIAENHDALKPIYVLEVEGDEWALKDTVLR